MRLQRQRAARSNGRRILVTASAALLSAVLIAFHVFLLWQRVLDQSLLKPVPAIRWLVTLALLAGLYHLHRQGVSLLRGRGALVFWLLILLLHVSFWGPLADPASTCAGWTSHALLLALPAITIVFGIVFASIRRLLARVFKDFRVRAVSFVEPLVDHQSYALRAGFLLALACRPPPAV